MKYDYSNGYIVNDFRVKCTRGYLAFTEGKIYNVKNGNIETDNRHIFSGYETLQDLNKYNEAQFIII